MEEVGWFDINNNDDAFLSIFLLFISLYMILNTT
jgi:hypothetical protein